MEAIIRLTRRTLPLISCLTLSAIVVTAGCSNVPSGDGDGGGNDNMNDNSGDGGNDNGGGDGGNDNGDGGGGTPGDVSSLQVILTNATADGGSEFRAGDDIIAIGTGNESGVQYIKPSRGDVDPISMTNFDSFVTAGFGVTGNWIMVRDLDGNISLFDGDAETLMSFDNSLLNTIGGAAPPGYRDFSADGDYFVVIMTIGTEGSRVRVVDLTSGTPVVVTFPETGITPVVTRENEKWQTAIDADAGQFVVQVTDFVAVYDLNDFTAAPTIIDLSGEGGITNAFEIHLDDGWMIYQTFEKAGNGRDLTRMVNVNTGESVLLSENPSQPLRTALDGGRFGYFAFVTDADNGTNFTARTVIGEVTDAGPEVTTLSNTGNAIGDDLDDGIIGFGCSVSITPDGRYTFIAGCGTTAIAEYLQVSTGGEFVVIADQHDQDFSGLGQPGSTPHASDTLMVFQTSSVIGYIELP